MLKTLLVIIVAGLVVYFGYPYVREGYLAIRYPTSGQYSGELIDVSSEPLQEETDAVPFFIEDREGRSVEIIPVATYDIQARVVINRGLPRYDARTPLGDVLTNDMGLVWGGVARDDVVDRIKFSHQFSYVTFRYNDRELHEEFGFEYISDHIASNHLIGANSNIDHALRRLGKGDIIRVKGYLINIQIPDEPLIETSVVRTDNWRAGEGNTGGSEFIYVTELQAGSQLYR